MHGHTAHRDVLAEVLAALGQHDAEGLRGDDRIVEEQLVEVAHPVPQDAVRIGSLDLEELRHRRRDVADDRACAAFERCAGLVGRGFGIMWRRDGGITVSATSAIAAICAPRHPDTFPRDCFPPDDMAHGAVRGKWRVVHRASAAYRQCLHLN